MDAFNKSYEGIPSLLIKIYLLIIMMVYHKMVVKPFGR